PSDRFNPLEQAMREPGSGRPTKKERQAQNK
ncbi:MAG: RNA-binding S4 domain-containing protein, partial [Agrobacterium sp.]